MQSEFVTIDDRDRVRRIALNRPAKKNALTVGMYAALAERFLEADTDGGVGAILLTGEGGAFTAGNDLRDFLENPPDGEDAPVRRFLDAVAFCTKPIIAAVPGLAIGVGTTILLHCDLVYASEDARFQTPFVHLGLVPEAASSLLLPQRIGAARASRLLLLGETIDAGTALAWGLLSEVVPPDELDAKAYDAARAVAAKPRRAVLESKKLMRGDGRAVAEAMRRELAIFGELLSSPDAKAAFAAFLAR